MFIGNALHDLMYSAGIFIVTSQPMNSNHKLASPGPWDTANEGKLTNNFAMALWISCALRYS